MLLVKSNFLRYCDVHEHGKLGISVTTSLFMTLVMVLFGSINHQDHVSFHISR